MRLFWSMCHVLEIILENEMQSLHHVDNEHLLAYIFKKPFCFFSFCISSGRTWDYFEGGLIYMYHFNSFSLLEFYIKRIENVEKYNEYHYYSYI
jgi:hypothetical protein